VVNGATSVWERWNSYTRGKGFYAPSMNSFSHYAFGAVAEWLFSGVGGISASLPGFRSVLIAPQIAGAPFSGVRTRYRSIRGTILSDWQRVGKNIRLTVEVPVNMTAEVRLPASGIKGIREGGRPVASVHGIKLLGFADGVARLGVGSGRYTFEARPFVNSQPRDRANRTPNRQAPSR
jgi:alpha-L-rhamnosidase